MGFKQVFKYFLDRTEFILVSQSAEANQELRMGDWTDFLVACVSPKR